MFNKMTTFSVDREGIEILSSRDMMKTASLQLPDGVEYDPDFLYMKVRAVSAGEYYGDNKNADFFPEKELIENYSTFLTAHTFKNHENKDVKNAIGDVLAAEWDDAMKGVVLLLRLDRKTAPGSVVRGYEKNFMTDVSMGCRISHSVCSICGNKAKTKHEYCTHINNERGRIYDDGRKVFEINIKPKFHDISMVLSGAEKVAKVTGIMIMGSKVAYYEDDTSLEKVASDMQEVMVPEEIQSITKIASEQIDLDMNEFSSRKMDKQAHIQKIADIKKEIQGRILGAAMGEVLQERQVSAEKAADIMKTLYTDYWDRDKCFSIASHIQNIANDREVSKEQAFCEFLKVLDFAGIELSPLEIHDISTALFNCTTPDLREVRKDIDTNKLVDFMHEAESITDELKPEEDVDLPKVVSTFHGLAPKADKVSESLTAVPKPGRKAMALLTGLAKPFAQKDDVTLGRKIMEQVVAPMMPERSVHRRFLIARVANPNRQMTKKATHHFMPLYLSNSMTKVASFAPYVLSSALYAAYQEDRVKRANSEELKNGMQKYASYIEGESMDNMMNEFAMEKEAAKSPYGIGRAIKFGVPATYAYSALQRSRINNRENVSSANRYVAENPGSASLMHLAFAPAIAGKGAQSIGNIKNVARKAGQALKRMPKMASFDNLDSNLYNGDIFKDHIFISKAGFSEKQASAIKDAIILTGMHRGDASDSVLASHGLCEDDMESFLKSAKDHMKEEIVKSAEEKAESFFSGKNMKNIAKGTAAGMIFTPKGVSGLASLPGNLIDGIIFNKLISSDEPSDDNQGNSEELQSMNQMENNFERGVYTRG